MTLVSKTMKNNKSKQFKPTKQLIIAVVLVIISVIFLSTSLFVLQASKPKVYEYGIYKAGTPIAAGYGTVILNKISYSPGQGSFVAPADKQYLILDTTFQNNSQKSIYIFPSNQTYLKDNSGKVYYLTPYTLEDPFRAGELLAGDKIYGQLSYLVPTDKSYTIYIDAIWSGGVVSARLN